jgi:glutamate racemase
MSFPSATHHPPAVNLPIRLGVLDSGVGGLSVLPHLLKASENKQLPPIASIDYVADTAWIPYGDKPVEVLAKRVKTHINWLAETKQVDAVVLACNTATTVALLHKAIDGAMDIAQYESELATAYSVPVVSPLFAVSQYLGESTSTRPPSSVVVLATETLLSSGLYQAALSHHMPTPPQGASINVIPMSGRRLATAVELGDVTENSQEVTTIAGDLNALLDKTSGDDVAIILGCTHYPHVWPLLATHLSRSVLAIDPAKAVPTALNNVLNDLQRQQPSPQPLLEEKAAQSQPKEIAFWVTGDNVAAFQQRAVQVMPSLSGCGTYRFLDEHAFTAV